MNSVYSINKGINKSIEFHGLKAQFIWYFGAMVMSLMVLYAVLYIAGTGTWTCILITGGLATYGSISIFRFSKQYGEYGLMKALARKRLPVVLKSYGRRHFQRLEGQGLTTSSK